MSEGHNDNDGEGTNHGATSKPHEQADQKSVSYYYDDSTNYETYCEDDDDDDEPTPTDEAAR